LIAVQYLCCVDKLTAELQFISHKLLRLFGLLQLDLVA